jgi:tetratricopeptide (TPR) repeat protein
MLAMRASANARHAFLQGGDARHTVSVSNQLASSLRALGDADMAREVLQDALSTARNLGMRPSVGWLSQTLGLVLARLGKHDEGMEAERAARTIAHEVGDLALGCVAQANLGVIALGRGAFDEALQHADATLALARLAPSASASFLTSRATRAIALLGLKQPAEALSEADRALARRARLGVMDLLELDLLLARHDALRELGREREAADAQEAAVLCFEHQLEAIDDRRLSGLFCDASPSHRRLAELAEERSLSATLRAD